jgi:hypothetical protein
VSTIGASTWSLGVSFRALPPRRWATNLYSAISSAFSSRTA